MAPVVLVLDAKLQKAPLDDGPAVPTLSTTRFPSADSGSIKEIARLLVEANNPRIVAGQAVRTQEGIDLLVELAELIQAPVNGLTERLNFPSRHPLAGTGTGLGDLVLNLEPPGRGASPGMADGTTITISSAELLATSNYNVRGNSMRGADIVVAADAQATLPALIEEVRRQVTDERRRHFEERGRRYAATHARRRQRDVGDARHGWDATPVSLARLAAELWPLIKDHPDDWSFVSPQRFLGSWPGKLWDMTKTHHFIGAHGAGGMGYGAPGRRGRRTGQPKARPAVDQHPGGWRSELRPRRALDRGTSPDSPADDRREQPRLPSGADVSCSSSAPSENRGVDRARIGTTIEDPNIDYAQMAKAYGLYAEGPIENPVDLGPALRRAVDRVKAGEPALLDVVTQPRG